MAELQCNTQTQSIDTATDLLSEEEQFGESITNLSGTPGTVGKTWWDNPQGKEGQITPRNMMGFTFKQWDEKS